MSLHAYRYTDITANGKNLTWGDLEEEKKTSSILLIPTVAPVYSRR